MREIQEASRKRERERGIERYRDRYRMHKRSHIEASQKLPRHCTSTAGAKQHPSEGRNYKETTQNT